MLYCTVMYGNLGIFWIFLLEHPPRTPESAESGIISVAAVHFKIMILPSTYVCFKLSFLAKKIKVTKNTRKIILSENTNKHLFQILYNAVNVVHFLKSCVNLGSKDSIMWRGK